MHSTQRWNEEAPQREVLYWKVSIPRFATEVTEKKKKKRWEGEA